MSARIPRGRWAVGIIILVALSMAIVTWPLLKVRRENEIGHVRKLVRQLAALCRQYQGEYRTPPPDLSVLSRPPTEPRDPWGRPIRYRNPGLHNPQSVDIWSLGRDPDDPYDDIGNWSNSGTP